MQIAYSPKGCPRISRPSATRATKKQMLKNLFRAFLVFRLEFRQPTLNIEAALSYWRHSSLIQYAIEDDGEHRSSALKRKLDEVYPF